MNQARPVRPSYHALLQTVAAMDLLPRRFGECVALAEFKQEILAMIFKLRRQGRLRQTLNQLRRLASIVRDRLSVDTWRILNQLHHGVRTPNVRVQLDAALALLNRTIMELAAFSGMEMENMTRGNGWRFLDIGRRLERSVNLVHLVRAALSAAGASDAVLEPLLEIADSSMTYRRRYYTQAQLAPVLDLLLADEGNPRSLAFQVNAMAGHIDRLPRPPHAWVSVYSPGTGWTDVDPTNNLVPANRHITLAWGRDFNDVSPVRGVILGGGDHVVRVAVDVVASGGEP